MNILLLCTHLNPGGISRYVITLAGQFQEMGHNVWVGSSGGIWLEELKNKNIKHKFIPINTKSIVSPKIIFSFFFLLPFLYKNKIQLVHCNTRVTQFLGYLIYKFLKIPYISTFHGFYRKTFFRRYFKFSGVKTIAISKSVKDHLIKDFNIGEDKIVLIYNGIDIERFLPKKKDASLYGFSQDDILLGMLGRISQEKGHFLAVQALKELLTEYPNVYLLICGWGRLVNDLVDFLDKLGIRERVRFFYAEAEEFLDILDILLVPSKKEGFGYTIIEAFAKGVPVVGFNVGGIAEIIRHKQNGILFYEYDYKALKEAIKLLLKEPSLKNKIIKNAKNDLSYFSSERMAQETQKIYLELIK
ncbi:MAG: glycosyltransferase family 4 protein [Candidatus Omnitrophica bacterium]|nr:glycosyltransferase family 4 protein [Candidatus Omnitrophota bacterium]